MNCPSSSSRRHRSDGACEQRHVLAVDAVGGARALGGAGVAAQAYVGREPVGWCGRTPSNTCNPRTRETGGGVTWVADMKKATSLRRYRIIRRTEQETGPHEAMLATAATDWAFVDFSSRLPQNESPPKSSGHSKSPKASGRRKPAGSRKRFAAHMAAGFVIRASSFWFLHSSFRNCSPVSRSIPGTRSPNMTSPASKSPVSSSVATGSRS